MLDHQEADGNAQISIVAELVVSNPTVSKVGNSPGIVTVVSRFADDVWELWPEIKGGHITEKSKRIDWVEIPLQFRMPCKVLMYKYWKKGREGVAKPSAKSIVEFTKTAKLFFDYLVANNVKDVQSIAPIHIANYVHLCRQEMTLGASATIHRLRVIDLLYQFRDDIDEALEFDPWRGSSIEIVSGGSEEKSVTRGVSQTELIPLQELKVIFEYAEGRIKEGVVHVEAGTLHLEGPRYLNLLRASCFFVLGLLTGMRYSELVSIEVGSTRTEVKGDTTFHFVQAFETKTKKGKVDYLLPSYGLGVIDILEKMSAPYRQEKRIQYEIAKVEGMLDELALLKMKLEVEADSNRIFLYEGKKKERGCIALPTNASMNLDMKNLAASAGSSWKLATHQLRRTFAWTFARHKLGNLLFLKEQLKHSSLSMTQMYAASPNIDVGVLNDIESELALAKADLVRGWLDGSSLAGGAGRRIEILRNNTFDNRAKLIEETAEKVSIRSTGHAWCLSQEEGCGGAGLYERARCTDCKNGVIDENFSDIWKEAYRHLRELSAEAEELGPAATQRITRDLLRAEAVLVKLGISMPG